MSARYASPALVRFAGELLSRSGLPPDRAGTVAEVLVEADLLGHTTHGLQLLPAYLRDLGAGTMAKVGEPRVIADFPAALTWDGQRLPGPWLTVRAIDVALARARSMGTATVVIRRSHHIACLAAYLQRATDQGMIIVLACSDPTVAAVTPHGGRRGVFSPDPLAAGWPTSGGPVLLDISQSITALGHVRRLASEGKKLAGQWAVDGAGNPTDDPAAVLADPPGALLPSGGLDHGHKGYALALLVEALTGGLAGHGRADAPREGWTATVFVQILAPALFAGLEPFVREASWTAEACRSCPPRLGFEKVRAPGDAGLARKAEQSRLGVELYPGIMPALASWARELGVSMPAPASGIA